MSTLVDRARARRRRLSSACLAIALGFAVPVATRAQPGGGASTGPLGDRELTVINRAKQAVSELYVSLPGADDRGDDRLGDDTIEPGKSFRAKLGRTRDCVFDVQVVYDDDSVEEMKGVNVCRTRQIAFDGSAAVAARRGVEHRVTLANDSSRPIQQVFISPAEASEWGDDRLGDDSISVSESRDLTYRGECLADLRVVFDNRSAEERRGVDLCETPRISVQPGWTTADTLPTTAPSAPPSTSPPQMQQQATNTPPDSNATTPPAQTPDQEATPVTIVNNSGHQVAELYVTPSGGTRDKDLLGTDVLDPAGRLVVRPKLGGACKVTIHVVYGGHTPDLDMNDVDVCANATVTLPPSTP